MFRADTDTNKTRAEPAREGRAFQQSDGPWWPTGSGLADVPAHLLSNHLLQSLRDAGGEFAAPLYFREIGGARLAVSKRCRQYVGCCDCVLDCQIDPDTAHRRHSVGRVADAHQARAIPLPQTIYLNRQ